ncbi:calcium-dependent phosphotriesterase [Rhodotorula sp. JG-1b]|nr:calcium-dependent phosphotriesterase [Rhodotorula sp. JG-1b]
MAPVLVLLLPIVSILLAVSRPRMTILGVNRTPHEALNIDRCHAVQGLEACEDAWIQHDKGLAYLACSSLESRANWAPGLGHLNATALPAESTDRLRLLDLSTRTHKPVRLLGLPTASHGVWLHGMDVLPHPDDPSRLVLFLVSHRPPAERALASETGADSVVEIFETRVGSDEAQWVATAQHDLVRTPNNPVATGPRSFYVTNDHARKVHWASLLRRTSRKLELAYCESSEIVHCEILADGTTDCIVAADALTYPNGIAKGPGDLLYGASTFHGEVTSWEIQSDKTLLPYNLISLDRAIDNIHVSPTTGNVYAATFPNFFRFTSSAPTPSDPSRPTSASHRSPVEIWRVSNETSSEETFLGRQYKREVYLADPEGEVVSAVTTAAPWRNQLLLTGFFTPHATVCEFEHEL